jgi:DHA3 family macrolide efflux protein-like MFS transporter
MRTESFNTKKEKGWEAPFFTIWGGQAFSLFGSSLAGFTLVWWLTDSAGSATVLAIGTLMQILPQILLGPLLGALVDRLNRRVVMAAADSVVATFSLGLAALFLVDQAQVWHVYLTLFVRALGGVFHLLAMEASTPLMVPEKHLSRVAGVNQILQGGMNVVSPALGALLLKVVPIHGVLFLDVGTALLAVVPLLLIPIPQPVRTEERLSGGEQPAEGDSLLGDLGAGLRYVWSWPGLRTLILMATISNFMTIPAMSFLPLVVTQTFGLDVLEVGWMGTAQGIGLLAGGLILATWGGFKKRMLTILPAVILMGAGLVMIGLAPVNLFMVALCGNLVFAFMRPVIDGSIFAMLQAIILAKVQGRVLAIILSGSAASAFGGLLIAGPVVEAIGLQAWFVLAGMVCAAVGLVGYFIPAVFHIEERQTGITVEDNLMALKSS